MTTTLQEFERLLDEVEEYFLTHDRNRQSLPLQAEEAFRQVLQDKISDDYEVHRLLQGAASFFAKQSETDPPEWSELLRKLLTDFVGVALRQRMGNEYDHILDQRFEGLGYVQRFAE